MKLFRGHIAPHRLDAHRFVDLKCSENGYRCTVCHIGAGIGNRELIDSDQMRTMWNPTTGVLPRRRRAPPWAVTSAFGPDRFSSADCALVGDARAPPGQEFVDARGSQVGGAGRGDQTPPAA